MTSRRRKWPTFGQVMAILNDFHDLGDVVSRINGRPKLTDWLAIAMKSGNVGNNLYNRVTSMRQRAAGRHLLGWAYLPQHRVVFARLRDAGRLAPDPDRTESAGLVPYLLDGQYRMVLNRYLTPPEFAVTKDDIAVIKMVSKDFIWRRGAVVNILADIGHVPEPPGIPRVCERELAERVQRYYNVGEHRVFLLTGLPGTGKTESALRVAYAMDLKTYFGHASRLDEGDFISALFAGADALIIDDLDWATNEDVASSLNALSSLRRDAKLIFVTANRTDNLPAPMLRPGRVDEVIEWPGCTAEEIAALGAPTECEGWPIAFVQEACTRIRVEGNADLAEIKKRIGMEPILKRRRDTRVRAAEPLIISTDEEPPSNGMIVGGEEVL